MMYLRQSTASQEIQLGKFVDSTDGATAETGLTIANTDIKLFKHGATSQASKNSGGATHIANGHYYAVLDATDTDTLGNLEITVDVSGALSVRREFVVLPAMVFDSLILGTDRLDANVTHVADTAQTAGDIPAMITAVDDYVDTEVAAIKAKTDNLPSDPADASDIAAAFSTVTGYIDTEVASILAAVDTEVAAIKAKTDNLPASPANEATLTTIAGYLDTEVAAIKAKTDNLPSDPADASDIAASFSTVVGYIDTEVASILAAVDTEVAAIKAKTDNLPTDPADQSAVEAAITAATSPLATAAALDTVDNFLDTEIAAIKAKTDSLTFTVAGQVDANIQYVNDVAVSGTGADGNEWGPA